MLKNSVRIYMEAVTLRLSSCSYRFGFDRVTAGSGSYNILLSSFIFTRSDCTAGQLQDSSRATPAVHYETLLLIKLVSHAGVGFALVYWF